MDDTLRTSWSNTHDPISKKIKQRIEQAGGKYFCNDNIEKYLEDGDLKKLTTEVQEKVQALLDSLVINTEKDHNIPGLLNLYGIESPGLTSSLSLAKYIAKKFF